MTPGANAKPWMGPLPAVSGCDCQVCRPEETYDPLDREVLDTVLRRGWEVIMVMGHGTYCHPEESYLDHSRHAYTMHTQQEPVFAYTIGLGHRFGHPELFISGLDPSLMHDVLDGVAERIMAGLRLEPGDHLEDVLAGVPVAVEAVTETARRRNLPWASWFHRHEPEALAIVWPDRQGVFAWQPGPSHDLDELQPPKWRMPIEHTGGLAREPLWEFPIPPEHTVYACVHVVEEVYPILWVARDVDTVLGEVWTIHCGRLDHDLDDAWMVHLAHLVRASPSLRLLCDLGIDEAALRTGPDSPWARSSLTP